MFYIYKITNKTNGKIYIGKTNNLYQRFHSHKHSVLKVSKGIYDEKTQYIHRAMNKHGIDNFLIEMIYQTDNHKECLDKEIEFIALFDSINRDKGYNLTKGGEGALGRKHTQEAIEIMRKKATGRLHSNEVKERMSKDRRGKGKKLSQTDMLSIRNLYANGISLVELSNKFNVSTTSIKYVCSGMNGLFERITRGQNNKINPNFRAHKITTEIAIDIYNEYMNSNSSSCELAKKYNLSGAAVLSILHKKTWKAATAHLPNLF